jgi:hypothetical protein
MIMDVLGITALIYLVLILVKILQIIKTRMLINTSGYIGISKIYHGSL